MAHYLHNKHSNTVYHYRTKCKNTGKLREPKKNKYKIKVTKMDVFNLFLWLHWNTKKLMKSLKTANWKIKQHENFTLKK